MRRTAIVVLVAGLLGQNALRPIQASPSRKPVNVNISRLAGNQAETAVAVNPTDPNNVVVTSNVADPFGLFEAFSMDGGVTWTTQIIADGDELGVACCDSSLAFDSFGNLFMTYLVFDKIALPVALSLDGGASFHVIDSITARVDPSVGPLAGRGRVSIPDQPTITTGPGSVWVTYTGGLTIQAAGAPVTGLGAIGRFSPPEVAVGTNEGHFGDIAIGPDGQVLVVFQDASGEGPSHMYADLDPDGLGQAGFEPVTFVGFTNVGDFDTIPAAAEVTIDTEAGLAWDRSGGPHNGRVYLLWTQEHVNESDDTEVMVQFSDDDGATWSRALRVNDDLGSSSQFMPKIALDQTTGDVAVDWYDCRNDLGAGRPGDTNGIPNDDAMIYAAVSTDGAITFGPNVRIAAKASNS